MATIAQAARVLKIDPKAVRKLIERGVIIPEPDGTLDLVKVQQQYASNRRPKSDSPQPPPRANGRAGPDVPRTYNENKQATAAIDLQLKELDFRRKSGELVEAEQVKTAAFNEGRRVRDLLLAIPSRLAPVLAGISDPAECERVIEREIRDACFGLAGGAAQA